MLDAMLDGSYKAEFERVEAAVIEFAKAYAALLGGELMEFGHMLPDDDLRSGKVDIVHTGMIYERYHIGYVITRRHNTQAEAESYCRQRQIPARLILAKTEAILCMYPMDYETMDRIEVLSTQFYSGELDKILAILRSKANV